MSQKKGTDVPVSHIAKHVLFLFLFSETLHYRMNQEISLIKPKVSKHVTKCRLHA